LHRQATNAHRGAAVFTIDFPGTFFVSFALREGYDRCMIDSNQLATGVTMGIVLIVMGLAPGLLQGFADGLSGLTDRLLLRSGSSSSARAQFHETHWFALAGVAVTALAILAYLAN
jgi:hypothetical protein